MIKINQAGFSYRKDNSNHKSEKSIGKGANGEVSLILQDNQKRALKKFPKSQDISEIEMLRQLDHPNILHLYEFYEDADNYYMVTDYWDGGDLYEFMLKGSFSEQRIQDIMKQLLSTLNYIHQKGIVHRDVKSENILVQIHEDEILIKLIDWGIATTCKDRLTKTIGTCYYMAPEVLRQSYDSKCDLWSAGILLYEMVTGQLPYFARYDFEVQRLVRDKDPDYSLPIWKNVSKSLLNLTQKLLQKDPKKRLSAEEALCHPFIIANKRSKSQDVYLNESVQRLKAFKIQNSFQKAILSYLSAKNNHQNESEMIQAFNSIDQNGDGKITFEELAKAFGNDIQAAQEASLVMEALDIDGSGSIDYSEFVLACQQRDRFKSQKQLQAAFHQFDIDGDGYISVHELQQTLGSTEEGTAKLLAFADSNGDGQISFEEFSILMTQL